jgi:hypothetical protein
MLKNHQDESHDDAERAREQAHADMQQMDKTARRVNPFSLTNIILTVSLGVGAWMASQIWDTLKETQKENKQSVSEIQRTLQESHDTLLTHGLKLDAMQSDISVLKQNCMTKDDVDREIWEKSKHPTSSIGGSSRDYPAAMPPNP